MSEVVRTKKGDTGRRIRFRVFEPGSPPTPKDLTGFTVKLYAGQGGVLKIDGATCTNEDQVAPETKGYAYYDPVAADVDTEGTYDVEVKLFLGTDPVSIPAQGFHKLIVSRSLA